MITMIRIIFYLRFIYLFILIYNIVLVLPYIDMNPHRCTCVLHPEPPSHIPPHPIPLGHPSATALSTLHHASNLDWPFVSHVKDSILKSRDITLPTKVCLVNAMIFPVVMYGCESWTVKKAER